jgi:hypothetical protein
VSDERELALLRSKLRQIDELSAGRLHLGPTSMGRLRAIIEFEDDEPQPVVNSVVVKRRLILHRHDDTDHPLYYEDARSLIEHIRDHHTGGIDPIPEGVTSFTSLQMIHDFAHEQAK